MVLSLDWKILVKDRSLIKRAVYGGKVAKRYFRNNLRSCMSHLNFRPFLADPEVHTKPGTNSDGSEHYEHALLCIDYVLIVSDNTEIILRNEIGKCFELKEERIGPPKMHLGRHARKLVLGSMIEAWHFSSSQNAKATVNILVIHLKEKGLKLSKIACTNPE